MSYRLLAYGHQLSADPPWPTITPVSSSAGFGR
jgi:hypothetical protein